MANVTIGTKPVGSIVKIKVDGTLRDFIIVHQVIYALSDLLIT